MKYKLFYLPAFNRDIVLADVNLIDFPSKAARMFSELEKKLFLLEEMPLMYPVFEPYPNYRKMVIDDYIVLYTVNELEGAIYLHRFLPGRMDIANKLT